MPKIEDKSEPVCPACWRRGQISKDCPECFGTGRKPDSVVP